MTFSLRTFLIVIAVAAVWLGALFSKSPLLIELVGYVTGMFVAVTLAFAIWDSRRGMRAFWTGFFVLGTANFLLANYSQAYTQLLVLIADSIAPQGEETLVYPSVSNVYAPSSPYFASPVTPTPSTYFPIAYSNQLNLTICRTLPMLFSFLAGGIGGWGTLWISRQKTEPKESAAT